MKKTITILASLIVLLGCVQDKSKQMDEKSPIGQTVVAKLIDNLLETHGEAVRFRIERGVKQAAALWREGDGTVEEFKIFVVENFIADNAELNLVFDRIAKNFEYLYGYNNRITLELNRMIHEDRGPLHKIDQIFGAYSPSAHVHDDFFKNKIAFIVALNFPEYSLEEKNRLGAEWDGRKWGMARLGEIFTARIPSSILQEINQVYSKGRLYISEYNIFAGRLLNQTGETKFPETMRLLAHWNVRDEIRSNYGQADGLEKQEMLYNVMLRIINQDIPKQVINNDAFFWNPLTNELKKEGQPVEVEPEGNVRYQHLLENFRAMLKLDPYFPAGSTYMKRRFDDSMEIPFEEVDGLFREYASSPLLRQAGRIISQRLGRPLRPFDLWYDGFKSRGAIGEEALDRITRSRFPNAEAMKRDLPRMLRHLQFNPQVAEFIASKIEVDAARGSGHAWRASMRETTSHLRTRIGANGMDYKGYNIAIHELGHNVEQTISVQMVDNYFVNGIPNTAFTEALAFMFQARDLELLGITQSDPPREHLDVLDVFWTNYEMMGVSLVDMNVWKWMYQNPKANADQLKDAVVRIAKEIWNEYYADVFGERDIPILAIYSHMIQSPLYLMNYPYGRLIMFQLEDYYKGKNLADETLRIFSLGRLTPRIWMERAVGTQISNQPIFDAVSRALGKLK